MPEGRMSNSVGVRIAEGSSCPIPISDYPHVLLAHGGGGRLMNRLIERMFLPAFGCEDRAHVHDSALIRIEEVVGLGRGAPDAGPDPASLAGVPPGSALPAYRVNAADLLQTAPGRCGDLSATAPAGPALAFTTDSYVVHPLFFPGGDIGALAVNGTVNDLAMSGARPICLSAAFIIEEGLPMDTLWRVVQAMKGAAAATGVSIVTGDTKVVEKGKGDGIFINTAGVGLVEHNLAIAPSSVRASDVILVNGDIGRHGMAVMAVREGLDFESAIDSDCAPLAGLVSDLISSGVRIHCMRDLTRGGLATALVEIAESAGVQITLEESSIPVRGDVHAACEILGFDPMYVACEGRLVVFVDERDFAVALDVMRSHSVGTGACVIGRVAADSASLCHRPGDTPSGRWCADSGGLPIAAAGVVMKTRIGAARIVDMLSGEQLPRIC